MNALHEVRTSAIPRNLTLKEARNLLRKNQTLLRRLEQKILNLKSKKTKKNKPVNVLALLNGLEALGFAGGGKTRKQKRRA